jgi:uncharacterized damage-inducible protein DinB
MADPTAPRHELLRRFERVRERTLRVARVIPPADLEWVPRADGWSFGDLLRHLASAERHLFVENACGRPSRYRGHGRELAEGYEAVFAYLERLHAESMAILDAFSEPDFERKIETLGGTSIRVRHWLDAMIEHEAHHRGQIYLMLGLRGVAVPPLYGLTEPEVRERSGSAR